MNHSKFAINQKVWYILIEGNEEGPYSIGQLRHDLRVKPETLARRSDWDKWLPIYKIKELKKIFEEEVEEEEEQKAGVFRHDVIAARHTEPGPFLDLLILLAIALLLWIIFQVFQ